MQTVESELQPQLFIAKIEKPGRGALALDYDDTLAPFYWNRSATCPYLVGFSRGARYWQEGAPWSF